MKQVQNMLFDTGELLRPDELERQRLVLGGITVVANFRRDKQLIAWAESLNLAVRVDRRSEYGNPFILGQHGDRDAVCDSFERETLPTLADRVHLLRGRVLCCWCHPARCHGDALARAANDETQSRFDDKPPNSLTSAF